MVEPVSTPVVGWMREAAREIADATFAALLQTGLPLGCSVSEANTQVNQMVDKFGTVIARHAPVSEVGAAEWVQEATVKPVRGSYVLAAYLNAFGSPRIVRAMYVEANVWRCGCDDECSCVPRDDDTDAMFWPEGWCEITDGDDDGRMWLIEGVTHWTPLPTHPALTAGVASQDADEGDISSYFGGIVSSDGFIATERGPIHVNDVASFFTAPIVLQDRGEADTERAELAVIEDVLKGWADDLSLPSNQKLCAQVMLRELAALRTPSPVGPMRALTKDETALVRNNVGKLLRPLSPVEDRGIQELAEPSIEERDADNARYAAARREGESGAGHHDGFDCQCVACVPRDQTLDEWRKDGGPLGSIIAVLERAAKHESAQFGIWPEEARALLAAIRSHVSAPESAPIQLHERLWRYPTAAHVSGGTGVPAADTEREKLIAEIDGFVVDHGAQFSRGHNLLHRARALLAALRTTPAPAEDTKRQHDYRSPVCWCGEANSPGTMRAGLFLDAAMEDTR